MMNNLNTFEKKKILFVHHKIGYGGANKMLVFVANTLAKNPKYDITIFTYASNEDASYKLDEKITLIKSEKYTTLQNKYKLQQFFSVKKIVNEISPHLIISFMSTNNFFSILSSLFRKTKVIISERGNPSSEKGIYAKIKLATYALADGIVFQTEGARSFFSSKVKSKSVVISNPVIDSGIQIKEWNERDKTISFVGRFDIVQKRQDVMIESFALVHKKNPDYKLVFYGDGDGLIEIKDLVKQKNLQNAVVFKGRVDNVLEEIAKSRIFVLTSDFEGIPNALIEAMSLGLPCVSTDCDPGGARLLIENNLNGLLVNKRDVKEIYNKICFLIDNPDFSSIIGSNAKKITRKYSKSEISREWEEYTLKKIRS